MLRMLSSLGEVEIPGDVPLQGPEFARYVRKYLERGGG
jgi:hypothetical protein